MSVATEGPDRVAAVDAPRLITLLGLGEGSGAESRTPSEEGYVYRVERSGARPLHFAVAVLADDGTAADAIERRLRLITEPGTEETSVGDDTLVWERPPGVPSSMLYRRWNLVISIVGDVGERGIVDVARQIDSEVTEGSEAVRLGEPTLPSFDFDEAESTAVELTRSFSAKRFGISVPPSVIGALLYAAPEDRAHIEEGPKPTLVFYPFEPGEQELVVASLSAENVLFRRGLKVRVAD